jgi:DNA-binding MarR family transcriptional regulator
MDNNVIDSIVDNIFHIFPSIYKKLLKADFEGIEAGMTYLHFLIVRMLYRTGPVPISEIGKRLMIPRPQMTHLIDQLISLDMVVRLPGTRDRRIINIDLTEKGKTTLSKCVQLLRQNIINKMQSLDEKELRELSGLLARLYEITSKIN